ncbi:MAG: hypothetical protein ABI600_15450 [Luteolibacter sp.]
MKKHDYKRLPSRLFLCFLSLATFMIVSCVTTSPVSNDRRFASVIASGVTTKRELHLYPPHTDFSDNIDDRYSLSEGLFSSTDGKSDYVATVPAHHQVHFENVRKRRDIMGGGEYLLGSLKLNGKTYSISYWLGSLGDETNAGWRAFFKSFEPMQ